MADSTAFESSNTDQYQASASSYNEEEGRNNGSHGEGNSEVSRNSHGQSHYPTDDSKKIFVGGLSWETTVKDLKEYFSKYGDVVDSVLKTDPMTGRSRGFGFVSFSSTAAVDKVVADRGPHSLHGKNIDPKRAQPKGALEGVKKLFVGGLDPEITEEQVRDHFGQFGKIVELDLPYDRVKQQRRAFCFITYDSESAVEAVVANPRQTIVPGSREVDVKKATPRQDQNRGQGGWGDRGGRGRGRGRDQSYGGGGGGGWNSQGGGGNYDYGNYYNQGGGGYDYGNSGYYGQGGYSGGYDGSNYDYNSYYNQAAAASGYDYNNWYGNQSGGQTSQGKK